MMSMLFSMITDRSIVLAEQPSARFRYFSSGHLGSIGTLRASWLSRLFRWELRTRWVLVVVLGE